ncbi:unnamed protein product [Staurois parvus]|uniref:Uncharacterized protein n=1 Tax=Staurois parvus TaxID=386267 RepID=A0ABN9C6J4_9NEOB|nr:unnamed protein product [Staurois parvus]
MCRVSPHDMSYQEMRGGHWKKGRIRGDRMKLRFYTLHRINPLGSIVSITSMLYARGGLTIWKLGHCPRARGQ